MQNWIQLTTNKKKYSMILDLINNSLIMYHLCFIKKKCLRGYALVWVHNLMIQISFNTCNVNLFGYEFYTYGGSSGNIGIYVTLHA